MKIFGAALCLGIIDRVAATVGVHLDFDRSRFVVPSSRIIFSGNYKMGHAEVLSPLIILYGFAIN